MKFGRVDGKWVKTCVIYQTKNISAASQTVATALIAPETYQGHSPTM